MMVRVLTYHKEMEAIEPEIVNAINNGNQVLVNAACFPAPATPNGNTAEIAAWAEALSQQHGLGWRRVGLDVLFSRANA